MSNWKFYLAESDDLTLVKDITNISRGKTISLSYNRSGNASFDIPLSLENLEYSKPNNKCLVVIKNGNIVWSGPIWTRSTDFNASKINLTAVGWFELLMYRFLTDSVPSPYTNINEGTVALGLLSIANTNHDTWISAGANTATTLRTITYEVFQSIGEEIINLSDTEYGFNLYVDPVTREMIIKEDNDFLDNVDIPFGYEWGPNNIENVVIDENGGEIRNRIHVVGSDNNVYTASDATSITDNNLMEEIIQITEKDDPVLLQAIANAEVAVKKNATTFEITMKPYGVSNPYGIFEDYNIGDKIYITANKNVDGELIQIEAEPRIFAATINIDENGREVVSSLKTTYSA